MKLLILGGGRRLSFCKQLVNFGYELVMYELDKRNPVSAQLGCETIVGLPWKDYGLPRDIIRVNKETGCIWTLPLDCNAVRFCGKYKDLFAAICSNMTTTDLCYNKREMAAKFSENSALAEFYPFPIENEKFVKKPIYGAGAKDISFGDSFKSPIYSSEHIFQRYLPGKEFTVDIYFSRFTAKLVNICVRERSRICGPEVIESITVDRQDIIAAAKVISKEITFHGPICMQFKDDEKGKPFLMEINGRVGGGTSLSVEAGLDLPTYIRDEYFLNKKATRTGECEVGVKMIRAFSDSYFRG